MSKIQFSSDRSGDTEGWRCSNFQVRLSGSKIVITMFFVALAFTEKMVCRVRHTILATLMVTLAIATPATAVTPVAGGPEGQSLRANILYLNSYHDGYDWSDEILDGLREGLSAQPAVDLQVEYMDFKRYPSHQIAPMLVDLYKRKFQGHRFDVVVVSDNFAFDFWQRHGKKLFPGVPMVFCGLNDATRLSLEGQGITGIIENIDVEATLNVALTLNPKKKRLVIIGDTSITGNSIMNQVLAIRDRFAGRLAFVPCKLDSIDALHALLTDASDDTMFYFIPFYTQLGGRFYSAQEILEIVHRSTSAPIYTNWEFLLAHGAVGGKMVSGKTHGRLAAADALRILSGTPVGDLPIQDKALSKFGFDYTVLKEQGINMERLPADSNIINQPQAFYRLNKQIFWIIIVFIAMLLLVSLLLVRNIVRRRAVEQRIQNQLSFQELLMDTMPLLICWKDRQNSILGANRTYLSFFGARDAKGLETLRGESRIHYENHASWANQLNTEVMRSAKPITGLKRSTPNVTGEIRQLEVKKVLLRDQNAQVVGTLTISEDVTRAADLEKQLLQSQKMEAIGNLSGGIAHDFNNILTSIINSIELSLMDVEAETPAGKDLNRALKAARRGSALVKRILTFSRPSTEGMVPTRIQDVVHDALGLLRASLPRNIIVDERIDGQLPVCVADPNQINQIVLNLCTNAFHALQDTGGTLTVTLGETSVGKDRAELKGLSPGRHVALTVTDDGPGIAPDIMDKIFDPFFTTKGVTEGTGLGLSMVMGLVHGHQGAIEVESRPGHTTFTVLIPKFSGPYEANVENPRVLSKGSGHLLFVEDDEDQYATVPRALERFGYTVTATQSAVSALSLVIDPGGFDAVITDFDMPVMNGVELAGKLGEKLPGVPVIIVTGRETALAQAVSKADNIRRIVFKPYNGSTLALAVEEVLTHDE